MSDAQLLRLLGLIWAGFGIYWITAALTAARARTHEARGYRLGRLSLLVLTFLLLFSRRLALGFLAHRFIPHIAAISYAGFACALAGMATATWARIHLGQFWSDKVVLKVDHQLIRTGPYARMRHPIYSGVLLGVAGTALVLGEWRGAIAFVLLLINYSIKAKREDEILAREFGDEFRQHQTQAGFLLPKFRPRARAS